MSVLQKFNEAWSHPNYPPASVSEAELAKLEKDLSIVFPNDYRESIVSIGAPSTIGEFLDWTIEFNDQLDPKVDEFLIAINGFYIPNGIREALEWRESGMPKEFIPIASDGCGSQIGFLSTDLRSSSVTAPIFEWDHDFGDLSKLDDSFEEWIAKHIPKPDDTASESS